MPYDADLTLTDLGLYVLDDAGEPVPEPDALAWERWRSAHDPHLAEDQVGPARVSTVFLGSDYDLSYAALTQRPNPAPILWETMVFWPGGLLHGEQQRYRSREAALAGHARLVERVKALLGRSP